MNPFNLRLAIVAAAVLAWPIGGALAQQPPMTHPGMHDHAAAMPGAMAGASAPTLPGQDAFGNGERLAAKPPGPISIRVRQARP